eukprot:CAMPEP_0181258208 /NCGR_PEP_ID=MMETSP1096-20121128/50657_1 /TAXON_ID=156174 ORGANISM="Chrysochromulina ericina, Strain CCMP281" /NCGR_SAMPLE_ID=MMETSP1096 /ASSEMBLY_ACC=CAM_ASM_000453 /LENGTH=150 /DNA_ID=CAMNT_0023356581 /DNA_START=504 /DNA_END=953 /DNA_ORIENTATION=+
MVHAEASQWKRTFAPVQTCALPSLLRRVDSPLSESTPPGFGLLGEPFGVHRPTRTHTDCMLLPLVLLVEVGCGQGCDTCAVGPEQHLRVAKTSSMMMTMQATAAPATTNTSRETESSWLGGGDAPAGFVVAGPTDMMEMDSPALVKTEAW